MKLLIDPVPVDPESVKVGEVYLSDDCVEIITGVPHLVSYHVRDGWDIRQKVYNSRFLDEPEARTELLSELSRPYRVHAIIADSQKEYDQIVKAEEHCSPSALPILSRGDER